MIPISAILIWLKNLAIQTKSQTFVGYVGSIIQKIAKTFAFTPSANLGLCSVFGRGRAANQAFFLILSA
jgi:hypothetical protein